jgi:ABC-2 type transport system ATP-binding protein/lipopolysaccharide transport system ATP-binding protein
LFDLSVGLDHDATGYENIVLRGLMLGLSRTEISALIPEIAEFTKLGDFLEFPLHTYSSGMLLRLSFAVSTAIQPDILLMDEWIGVGDASFVKKAEERLKATIDRSRILVIASHSEQLIERICSHAILLDHGKMLASGEVEPVIAKYRALTEQG